MVRTLFSILALGVACYSPQVLACKQMPAEERVVEWDDNGDGVVSLEEYTASIKHSEYSTEANIKKWFGAIDGDKDGTLTVQEVEAHQKANPKRSKGC